MSDTEDTTEGAASATPPAAEAQAATADDFDKERALETIRKQRAAEKELRAQLKELEALKAEKAEREQAQLSEAEKLRKRLQEVEQEHASATAELKRARLLQAAQRAAEKAQVTFYPGALEDAMRLGLFDTLEWDEDGQPKGLTAAINALAKERPNWLRTQASGADLDARARGTTSKQDEEARKVERNATRWGILLGKQG